MSDVIERQQGPWSMTFRRNEGRPTWRVTAVHADRKRVIRDDRLTEAEVFTFDASERWAFGLLKLQV